MLFYFIFIFTLFYFTILYWFCHTLTWIICSYQFNMFLISAFNLLFNMLSRWVIALLSRSKCLLISWLQVTICSDFGAPQNKICHCFHCFPIYLPSSDGARCHDLCFWMLSFKPTFSVFSFTFIKRLFSSSSLPAKRLVSSAYLRLLIFLPAVLIPACASSSLVFHMMHIA